jgi:hypothetical protein
MTTTVTVAAHCDPKTTKVRIEVTAAHGGEVSYLTDGETREFYAYDDQAVVVHEVPLDSP